MGGTAGVRARHEKRYIPGRQLHLERDQPKEQATLVLSVSPSEG
jgi:hypothetical protein